MATRNKNLILMLFVTAAFPLIYLIIGGFPVIISNNGETVVKIKNTPDKTCNPLSAIDFSTGQNEAFLIISWDDLCDLPNGIPQRRVLICKENSVLQKMKDNFIFKISGGDMATIESELIVVKDNTIILQTGIEICENNIGIQNEQTGWAYSTCSQNLCDIFKEFKPYRNPILNIKKLK